MKINVAAVLAGQEQRKKEGKLVPKIVINLAGKKLESGKTPMVKQVGATIDEKTNILNELEYEFTTIKKERAILSTKTFSIVDDIIKKLSKEGAAVVKAFKNGEIPVPALKDHYNAITAKSDQLEKLYDQIEYVKTHGAMPSEPTQIALPDSGQSIDAKAIHYEIRRLEDLICKTNKKIAAANGGLKAPKNPERNATWNLKLTLAKAAKEELKDKLKRMQYERKA
jgi:predicted  nucleic acid-binding Zn-ribbon protein